MLRLRKLKKINKSICIILLFLFYYSDIKSIELYGDYIQGGLVIGKLTSNANVYLDDKVIPVDSEGNFLFGFSRKNNILSKLKIIYSSGKIYEKKINVKTRKYKIQRIDSLDKNKVNPPKDFFNRIIAENRLIKAAKSTKVLKPYYKKGFIMPAEGIITGVYGSQRILNGTPKRPHYGLDIANKMGTDVIATSDGEIVLVEKDLFYSGGTIIISHGLGLTSSYLHLSSILVEKGDVVVQGQKVGEIGATGRATGPHLDWRMQIRETRIDPRLLLNKEYF